MRELVTPTPELYAAWRAARDEWGPGLHEDGFGIHPDDDVDTRAGFAAWVARLTAPAPGHASYWWIVEGGDVLGAVALRHELSATARTVGQVGYGVRPSARGRGVATWALTEVLARAWDAGQERLLVVCEEGNLASARVIERVGGVLEDVREGTHGPIARYWIRPPCPASSSSPER